MHCTFSIAFGRTYSLQFILLDEKTIVAANHSFFRYWMNEIAKDAS
jgi:hypothetical protein